MTETNHPHIPPIIMLYAVGMQQASAGGDLAAMRSLAAEAEKHLADYGNVAMALEVLKVEIAKLEARGA